MIPTDGDWETPSATGASVTPQIATAQQIRDNLDDYESELVEVKNASFVTPAGDFAANTTYPINDGSGINFPFRTNFPEADYVVNPTAVPSGTQNIIGIVMEFSTAPRLTSRNILDISAVLSVQEFDPNYFSVYPNPTALNYVNITSNNNSKTNVIVFDMLGKQVINKTLNNNNRLDISNLKAGLFILKISQDNNTFTKKLIIL